MNSIKNSLSEEIKQLVCKLPDIKYCTVVCNEKNEVEEIHVLSGMNRNVKQLVRDIQSAISAKLGITIDYKIISIAQIDENDVKEVRLKLDGVSVKNIDNSIEVTVVLSYDGRIFEGKIKRVKSRSNKFKAIAEATIIAVESYLGIGQSFYLEDIRIVSISSGELLTCVIGFAMDDKEELMSGCSLVNSEENEAVAKAVLAAVNRKISIIG